MGDLDLVQAALDLNPWYSAWLWNVLGNSLTDAGRHDEAHDCHLPNKFIPAARKPRSTWRNHGCGGAARSEASSRLPRG